MSEQSVGRTRGNTGTNDTGATRTERSDPPGKRYRHVSRNQNDNNDGKIRRCGLTTVYIMGGTFTIFHKNK